MPYIIFPKMPAALGVGRTARNAVTDPVTGEYVCEVDEAQDGEKETTAEHHAVVRKAAEVEASKPRVVEQPAARPRLTDDEIIKLKALAAARV